MNEGPIFPTRGAVIEGNLKVANDPNKAVDVSKKVGEAVANATENTVFDPKLSPHLTPEEHLAVGTGIYPINPEDKGRPNVFNQYTDKTQEHNVYSPSNTDTHPLPLEYEQRPENRAQVTQEAIDRSLQHQSEIDALTKQREKELSMAGVNQRLDQKLVDHDRAVSALERTRTGNPSGNERLEAVQNVKDSLAAVESAQSEFQMVRRNASPIRAFEKETEYSDSVDFAIQSSELAKSQVKESVEAGKYFDRETAEALLNTKRTHYPGDLGKYLIEGNPLEQVLPAQIIVAAQNVLENWNVYGCPQGIDKLSEVPGLNNEIANVLNAIDIAISEMVQRVAPGTAPMNFMVLLSLANDNSIKQLVFNNTLEFGPAFRQLLERSRPLETLMGDKPSEWCPAYNYTDTKGNKDESVFIQTFIQMYMAMQNAVERNNSKIMELMLEQSKK